MIVRADSGNKVADEITITLSSDRLKITASDWRKEDNKVVKVSVGEPEWTLDELRMRNDWQDRTMYSLGLDNTVYPTRAATAISHESEGQHLSHARPLHWLRMLVPDTECTLEDCILIVQQPQRVAVSANVSVVQAPINNPDAPWRSILPKLRLTGPDTSPVAQPIIMSVALCMDNGSPYDGMTDVYLETVNGYLPKTRVRVADCPVPFKVLPIGLDAGDSIRVKVGFRYFSSAREHVVRLV